MSKVSKFYNNNGEPLAYGHVTLHCNDGVYLSFNLNDHGEAMFDIRSYTTGLELHDKNGELLFTMQW